MKKPLPMNRRNHCHRRNHCRRGSPGRRGATMVESAIALAVALLLLFGALDLGLAVTRSNALGDAARRAARVAMVRGERAGALGIYGPETLEFSAAADNPIAVAARDVLATIEPSQVQVRVEWPDGHHATDARVLVVVSYAHQPLTGLTFGSPLLLRGTSSMAVAH